MEIIIPGKKRRLHRSTTRIIIYSIIFAILALGLVAWYVIDGLGDNTSDQVINTTVQIDPLKSIKILSTGNEIDDIEDDLARTDLSKTILETKRLLEIKDEIEAWK